MIQAKEVRIIDEDKKQLGILPHAEALSLAKEKGLDLVEVAPQAVPPVCRIMDYGKYLYELHKKAQEAKNTKSRFRSRRSNSDPR